VLTRFSTTLQKSGRVPDFFCLLSVADSGEKTVAHSGKRRGLKRGRDFPVVGMREIDG
jgi:hypothetical protein